MAKHIWLLGPGLWFVSAACQSPAVDRSDGTGAGPQPPPTISSPLPSASTAVDDSRAAAVSSEAQPTAGEGASADSGSGGGSGAVPQAGMDVSTSAAHGADPASEEGPAGDAGDDDGTGSGAFEPVMGPGSSAHGMAMPVPIGPSADVDDPMTTPPAATPPDPAASEPPAEAGCLGDIRYTLARVQTPDAATEAAYARITEAMDTAIEYYNCNTEIDKALRVSYLPSVSTADGNPNGSIRFGSNDSMNYITAMHEISHTLGIGDSNWDAMIVDGVFPGMHATAQLREITGNADDVVHGDNQHFWPYGLNYTSEVMSEQDLIHHCAMVVAIRRDLGY